MESDMYIYIGTGGRVPKGQFSLGVARRGLLWSGGWGGASVLCFISTDAGGRESVVYWYSFSNPRTRRIHCDNCLVIYRVPRVNPGGTLDLRRGYVTPFKLFPPLLQCHLRP